jgi:hypothetical protein
MSVTWRNPWKRDGDAPMFVMNVGFLLLNLMIYIYSPET